MSVSVWMIAAITNVAAVMSQVTWEVKVISSLFILSINIKYMIFYTILEGGKIMKKILCIFFCLLLLIGSFSSITYASEPEKKIQLTQEQLQKIDDYVNKIENYEKREKVNEILNEIISEDGVIDLEKAMSLSLEYYNSIRQIRGAEAFCTVCAASSNETSPILGGQTFGTSTVFSAPFINCFSWGDGTFGLDDWVHACNRYSGSIGTYAAGFIGGATAEAQQKVTFYVGETKTISVDAKIIYIGGGQTVGIGAFAGTEKTWWRDNVYGRADIDPWLGWDDVVYLICDFIELFGYGAAANIAEAIQKFSLIMDIDELLYQLYELITAGDAEIHHATFTFSASPGYHTILAGLRASASGFITGTGVAVAAGAVESITINGYAPPNTPTVNGPGSGTAGQTYSFSAVSTDPNGDDIKYQFDWGDGNIEWTDFEESGIPVSISHQYEYGGIYTIKVKAKDKDLLESNYGTHTITISSNHPNMPTNPIPENGATNIDINTDLTWNGGGGSDPVKYKIFFGTNPNPGLYYDNYGPFPPGQTTITFPYLQTLGYNTKYYWKIVAYNDIISIPGPVWNFTTIPNPNQPPNIPETPSGPSSGYTWMKYSYSTETTDPNGDWVKYGWDWGDGSPIEWRGPYTSGTLVWNSHTWYDPGTYSVRVKAVDDEGAESDFSSSNTVTIQWNQAPHDPIITGPSVVDIDTPVQFIFSATDPNNSPVKFGIDWKYYSHHGDPHYDQWTGYINSGDPITVEHTFDVGGHYEIVVVAEDNGGERSNYVRYIITVLGGNVILGIQDTWTKPNRFTPNQDVDLYYSWGNTGNRDGYSVPILRRIYLDGDLIYYQQWPALCSILEAGEIHTFNSSTIWPDDYDVHEIKYYWSGDIAYLNKSAVENDPPDKPSTPDGETHGESGVEYTYTSSTTDPNEHQLYYKWDWGDGEESDWLGPYESGATCAATHNWSDGGYNIRVKAKDIYDAESEWSDPLHITMPFGYGCPQGTQVTMAGSQSWRVKNIENIQAGDIITSYDFERHRITAAVVTSIHSYSVQESQTFYSFNNVLEVSSNYFLYINNNEWIEASDIHIRDFMLKNNPGSSECFLSLITSMRSLHIDQNTQIYHLEIEPLIHDQNVAGYFANGILVGGYAE